MCECVSTQLQPLPHVVATIKRPSCHTCLRSAAVAASSRC
jgi:hypothetical protein